MIHFQRLFNHLFTSPSAGFGAATRNVAAQAKAPVHPRPKGVWKGHPDVGADGKRAGWLRQAAAAIRGPDKGDFDRPPECTPLLKAVMGLGSGPSAPATSPRKGVDSRPRPQQAGRPCPANPSSPSSTLSCAKSTSCATKRRRSPTSKLLGS